MLTVDADGDEPRAGQRHRHGAAAAAELEGRRLRQPVRARRRRRRQRRHGRLQERHRRSTRASTRSSPTSRSGSRSSSGTSAARRRPASRSRRRSGRCPFGQNNCERGLRCRPDDMAAGATFKCRYEVDAGSAGTIQNIVTALSTNAVPTGRNNSAARQLDRLREPQPADPQPDRPQQGGRPGGVDGGRVHGGQPERRGTATPMPPTVTQNKQAFQCVATTTTMTISR